MYLDEFVASNHSEGKVVVVVLVDLSHCFILQRELVDGHTVTLQLVHDLCLELVELCLVDCVGLGDNWDYVDLLVQLLHANQVDALEAVTIWSDEVETHVDSVVRNGHTVHSGLCFQEDVELLIDVLYDGLPTSRVVNTVSKSFNI